MSFDEYTTLTLKVLKMKYVGCNENSYKSYLPLHM